MPTLIYTKNGWLSATSQFTSDRSQARVYKTFPEAVDQCRRFYSNGVIAVPVRQFDLGYMA
jgi:hypothetical protein